MATLMISQGVPMILGGDEFLRTQQGNNNAWCQDNPIELGRLVAAGAQRRLPPVHADDDRDAEGAPGPAAAHVLHGRRCGQPPEILWHGVEPSQPDFGPDSHALAFALDGRRSDRPGLIDRDIYVAVNAWQEPLDFSIPAAPSGRPWRRAVDTALPSPEDIIEEDRGPRVPVLEALSRAGARDDHPRLRGGWALIVPCARKTPSIGRDKKQESSPTRTRTLNLAVNSRSLYRLSYRGIHP